MSIGRTDFMELVAGDMERGNPRRNLEPKSLSLDEIEAEEVDQPRSFIHQRSIERQSTLIGGNRGATKSLLALTTRVNLCGEQKGSFIG